MNRDIEFFKKIDGGFIKGCGKEYNTLAIRYSLQSFKPAPRRICLLVQLIQCLPAPFGMFHDKMFLPGINGYRIGCIGLEFYRVGSGLPGFFNKQGRLVKIVPVISRDLRDYESRFSASYGLIPYLYNRIHCPSPSLISANLLF